MKFIPNKWAQAFAYLLIVALVGTVMRGVWYSVLSHPYIDLATYIVMGGFSIIVALVLLWIGSMLFLSVKQKHREIESTYSLPYQQQTPIKIVPDAQVPQKLQQPKRTLKALPPMNKSAKMQRRKFAIQRGNGFTPIANDTSATLQDDNLPPATLQDDIDAQIIAAGKELREKGEKATGIAVAEMTGIPQRTVYDRISKLKKGQL